MDFALVPISQAPRDVPELLWSMRRSEGSWGWYTALAEETLAGGESAVLALLQAKSRVVAALPLVSSQQGKIRALTSPYTTYFGPAAERASDAEALGRCLGQAVRGRFMLDSLDARDPVTAALLKGIEASRLVTLRYRHFVNWHESITDFETYWASRSSQLRAIVSRRRQRLEREGRLRFIQLRKAADVAEGIALYEEIYGASWKPPEPHPDFMPRMLRVLAEEGTARLCFATIDGKGAATQIWLLRAGHATIFKLAHRPEFDSHSPGTLLTHWMLSQLASQKEVTELDFGRGDDAYKRSWLGQCSFRTGVIGGNPARLRGLYGIARDVLPARIANLARRRVQP